MRQQTQNAAFQDHAFSCDSVLYTIYRHHHGLNHEQAVAKIEATRTCIPGVRAA